MTKEQIEQRVTYWKGVLQCEHVRVYVEIEDGTNERGAYATCIPHPHYDQMRVVFKPEQFEQVPRDLDEVVVHELLHFLFRDYNAAAAALEDEVGEGVQSVFADRLEHEEERVVDKLARVIVALDKA